MAEEELGAFDRIRAVIRSIPYGATMSYGEVAARAGLPGAARTVVWVLKSTNDLPWHRVVRKDGTIAIADPDGSTLQRLLLESEGVKIDENNRVMK